MKKNWKKKIRLIFILAVFLIVAASIWYVRDYYHSEESVQEYFQKDGQVKIIKIDAGLYLDGTKEDTALIFYPGAKVEYTAYLPLLYQLAEQGIDCFLIKMPFNLAIFGQNKAETIMKLYDYNYWYLSGHSLGGAMAANASKHLEKLNGLILLAAYPTKSLKKDGFSAISIYGSEDLVLNRDKLIQGRNFMPSHYIEMNIEGGNHALFGNYGEQTGDGIATISREEQQKQTVEAMIQFIKEQEERKENETMISYQQITQKEAKELMGSEKDILILDVRTQEEYKEGHIKGAICLPNEEIAEGNQLSDINLSEILPNKNQIILVYCRSGNRSKQAAQKLADLGYKKVLEFGGIIDWSYQEMLE